MQYRAAFLFQSLGHFLITGLEFVGLAAVFQRFDRVGDWTLPEMSLFYGIISVAFALAEAIPRGFDVFHRLVRTGDFDRMLLRPRSPALQVLGHEFQLMRIGRLVQAVVVLILATLWLDLSWTPARLAMLVFAIAGGVCLFSGLFILQATVCFWTIESIELVNCTTYGGVEAAQFPVTIYRPWFRKLFTFVIPLATVNYFPTLAILGRDDPLGTSRLFQCLSPLLGVVFLGVCLALWRIGVRRYASTGS